MEAFRGIPMEDYFLLKDLPDHCPISIHASTGNRWARNGVRGQKLKTVMFGGKRYTCRQWLNEFIQATTEAAAE